MGTLVKAWTTVCALFAKSLEDLADATKRVTAETVAVPWWGAAVTAVGLKTGQVKATPTTTKPRIKAVDKEGNANRTMASLFDLPSKGSENDYNVGCLFAACCERAGVTGWDKAVTAEAWQKIGARSGYHVLTASDLKAVADGLRKWYVGGSDYHNVTGLKAVLADGLEAKAEAERAEAEEEAERKANKAKRKAKTKTKGSAMARWFRGGTRTQAKADALAWIREDRLEARSYVTMFAQTLNEVDEADAKAEAEAKAEPVVSKGATKPTKAKQAA